MSLKAEVKALILAKKEEKLAAVAVEFDAMISQIDALAEDGDVAALQAKLEEEILKEAKLQAKLDAIKAALEG